MQQRKDDPTTTAVTRQLKAMGLEKIEVSLIYPKVEGEPPRNRVFVTTPEALIKQIPQLKLDNKRGANVFIRGPRDQDHALILVDDIGMMTPDKMAAVGMKPAVVVESSPQNFQAWIKLNAPQSAEVRLEVARLLAERFDGDKGAVGAHQAARIAGFTNQKGHHRQENGYQPFTKLISGWGKPISMEAEKELLREARLALEGKEQEKQAKQAKAETKKAAAKEKEPGAARMNSVTREKGAEVAGANAEIATAWRGFHEQRIREAPGKPDLSSVDYRVTRELLRMKVDPAEIEATLESVSDRKGKHAASYAALTVANAMKGLERSSPGRGMPASAPRPSQEALQR